MIDSLLLIALGAFLALYCSNLAFHEKVNDMLKHVRELFIKKKPVTPEIPPVVEQKPPV